MLVDVYTPHIPIIINSNEDFISQGWSGNGTESNPYVIEGLSIISSETCISISDTNVHFEIRNCLISASNLSTNNGIAFSNVMNGVIRDCFVELHYYGIYLYSSSFCSLMNNNATKNLWYGFYLSSSTSCILTNNTACENKYGFYLSSSSLCILTDNTLYGNGLVIRGDSVSNWLHT
ncbi:MAG: NosD domain-containing protein, partial [Candidatus Thorarchaeota archaeon]